jgi:ABC-type nitrate/sulfonate/bicarbonate transport system substrate-binding protein
MTRTTTGLKLLAAVLFCASIASGSANAQDKLKLTVGQKGNWATSVAEVGQRGGVFKKHGLELELIYTQGSGETQQAVIAGSVDVGVAVGTLGALGAFAKGAPVRIIGAETTGASDLYWFVKKDSPIKTIQDFNGKTVAYSTNGSSTHGVVLAYIQQYGIKPTLVATGSPTATMVQVLSGQVDVGWSAPPDGLDQLDKGEIRVIANGNDASIFKNQTVRVLLANAQTMETRKDVMHRFMQAYRETVHWLYSDDAALKVYADWLGISIAKAKRSRDDFYPPMALDPDVIAGLDAVMADAVKLKFIPAPLSPEQLKQLVEIPPS